MIARPFFREFGLKGLAHSLEAAPELSGFERVQKKAASVARTALGRFTPKDWAHVVWGLALVIVSYALHSIAEVIEYFGS